MLSQTPTWNHGHQGSLRVYSMDEHQGVLGASCLQLGEAFKYVGQQVSENKETKESGTTNIRPSTLPVREKPVRVGLPRDVNLYGRCTSPSKDRLVLYEKGAEIPSALAIGREGNGKREVVTPHIG